MGYRMLGALHARALALRGERGQGTIEYVGLILLIAGVITAVVAFGGEDAHGKGIAKTVIDKFSDAIEGLEMKG